MARETEPEAAPQAPYRALARAGLPPASSWSPYLGALKYHCVVRARSLPLRACTLLPRPRPPVRQLLVSRSPPSSSPGQCVPRRREHLPCPRASCRSRCRVSSECARRDRTQTDLATAGGRFPVDDCSRQAAEMGHHALRPRGSTPDPSQLRNRRLHGISDLRRPRYLRTPRGLAKCAPWGRRRARREPSTL